MTKSILRNCVSVAAIVAVGLIAVPASAQTAPEADAATADEANQDIIVTAQPKATARLRSSISVSTLKGDDLTKFAPRSVTDLLRNIPGIHSEASGGESNANVSFRGLPIASVVQNTPISTKTACPSLNLAISRLVTPMAGSKPIRPLIGSRPCAAALPRPSKATRPAV